MKLGVVVIGSGKSATEDHVPAYERIPAVKAPGETHTDVQRRFISAELIA